MIGATHQITLGIAYVLTSLYICTLFGLGTAWGVVWFRLPLIALQPCWQSRDQASLFVRESRQLRRRPLPRPQVSGYARRSYSPADSARKSYQTAFSYTIPAVWQSHPLRTVRVSGAFKISW